MFVWRLLDGTGSEVGTSEGFEDRDAAEAWLGPSWEGLADRGVNEVELVLHPPDGGADVVVYRMSLAEG